MDGIGQDAQRIILRQPRKMQEKERDRLTISSHQVAGHRHHEQHRIQQPMGTGRNDAKRFRLSGWKQGWWLRETSGDARNDQQENGDAEGFMQQIPQHPDLALRKLLCHPNKG